MMNCCWFRRLGKNRYRIVESTGLFEVGQIVTISAIRGQFKVWGTGRVRDGFTTEAAYQAWKQAVLAQ